MKKLLLITISLLMWLACSTGGNHLNTPNFYLEDVDGNPVILHSLLAEGPVFICIWALWCKMAIKELDALKPYYDEFESMGLRVLAISQDKTRAVPKVKPFAMSHDWKYTIVLDPDNIVRELYNIKAMPTCFIIDQRGEIVFTFEGYRPGDEEIIISEIRYLFGD